MNAHFVRIAQFRSQVRSQIATGTVLLCALLISCNADVLVTFDPPLLPHGGIALDSYSENGVVFSGTLRTVKPFIQTDSGLDMRPDDGSAHLDIFAPYTRFGCANGDLFTLNRLDLAEYSTWYATPKTVQFTGVRSDDTLVTFLFTTDGIIDGPGPAIDFETVTLPSTFTDLQRVEFTTYDLFSIDNISLTVPEPHTFNYVLFAWAMLMGSTLRSFKLRSETEIDPH